MADIRINALATTATTPASDDFLALDGTAQGTRKILATNIANNVTDVILGASGPSVKSTLSARAPRQGLVFDGTAGATVANVPAFGTGDFTFAAWVNQPTLAAAYLCSATGGADSAFLYLVGNGTFQWWSNTAARATSSAGAFVANKWTLLTATRTGGTTTLYANGVSVGSGADSQNLTSAIDRIGQRAGGTNILNGSLIPLIYNRALSASEVVALYEAGAPAGADYPGTAAGTSLSVNAFDATRWSSSFATFTGASATGFTATRASGAGDDSVTSDSFTVKKGDVIRCVFDMTNSADLPYIYLGDASTGAQRSTTLPQTTAGSAQVFLLTASAAGSVRVAFYTANAQTANYTIANFTARPLGLLLAPDAAQAGGGLVWYDTSGNAANITLPASGVSWNVPSSRVLGGNWTTSGNLTVSGTGTSSVAGSFQVGATTEPGKISLFQSGTKTYSTSAGIDSDYWGVRVNNTSAANQAVAMQLAVSSDNGTSSGRGVITAIQPTAGTNTGALAFQTNTAGTISETMRLINGNALFGTTADSGNGRIQLATHTTSAGGIGFGTDTSLFRAASGNLCLNDSGTNAALSFYNAGTLRGYVFAQGSTTKFILGSLTAGWSTEIQSGNGTTALTLDSSQHFKLTPAVASSIITTQSAPQIRMGSRATGRSNVVLDSTAGRVWNFENTGTNLTIGYSGLDAVTIAETTGNATFAGTVTANGNTIVSGNGNNSAQLRVDGVSSGYSIMTWSWDASYKWHAGMTTGGNNWSIGKVTAVSTWTPYLTLDHSTGNATFSGAIAIGNTVNTVSPTSPNRTITMVIGGTTYYIHAKTTND